MRYAVVIEPSRTGVGAYVPGAAIPAPATRIGYVEVPDVGC